MWQIWCLFNYNIKAAINQCEALYIINSAGIAYHQNVVLYIINGETVAYHQADSFLIHTFGVMRYKCDLSHLMIYTLTRDDMPSLSAWINTKKERRLLFVLFCVGIALFSRAASSQVFSALMSLTSVFGMGTGGPSPPMTPTIYIIH